MCNALRRLRVFRNDAMMAVVTAAIALSSSHCFDVRAQETRDRSAATPPAVTDTAGSRDAALKDRAYLLTRGNDGNDTLLLVTIPASDDEDQTITTRKVVSEPHAIGGLRMLGVRGGHLVALNGFNQIVAIDLNTGVNRQITQRSCDNVILVGDHLFFVSATGVSDKNEQPIYALQTMDLSSGKASEVCQLSVARSPMQPFGHDISLVATPDHSRIAVTEMIPGSEQFSTSTKCRVVVVDADTGQVSRSQPEFMGNFLLTGGGDHLLAPRIAWVDDEALLVVSPYSATTPEVAGAVPLNSTPLRLLRYEPRTGGIDVVCSLPAFQPRMDVPGFSREGESKLVIHLGSLGPFLVDLKNKALVEHTVSIGEYRLEPADGAMSLRYRDELVAPEIEYSRVFASPDAQRIAWLPPAAHRGIVVNQPVELKMHDRIRGVRRVLTAGFSMDFRDYSGAQMPGTNTCLWLTDADLVRTTIFDQLKVMQKLPQPPHVDARPAANDSVQVDMTTDKAEYILHDPVELTITVKNIGKDPVRLESRLLMQGAQPFHDLTLKTSESSQSIRIFDRSLNKPVGKYVEILPGQSGEFTRTVESGDLGEHELRLRFEHYSSWSGYVIATTRFEVREGGDPAALLRKKFDRLMATWEAEFAIDPTSVPSNRFEQLGTPGAPLLVNYLRTCQDGGFRRHLGRCLPQVADESTLPYLRELLKTDLQYDGDTFAATLREIHLQGIRRLEPFPETSDLLLEAARHRNVEVRRAAVNILCLSVSDTVDQFMQEAAEDADPDVAQTAGRYVAARQGLPLHQWLFFASRQLTPASLAAARSIVAELEQKWSTAHGVIPAGTFAEVVADPQAVAAYSETLKEWVRWCLSHRRSTADFFRGDRERVMLWHGKNVNRHAVGEYAPIILKPRMTHVID